MKTITQRTMKKIALALLSLSLCLGAYSADKNKGATEKPAKADTAKKAKRRPKAKKSPS